MGKICGELYYITSKDFHSDISACVASFRKKHGHAPECILLREEDKEFCASKAINKLQRMYVTYIPRKHIVLYPIIVRTPRILKGHRVAYER